MEGADEFVVVGHLACSNCGDFVLETARTARLGLCDECTATIDEAVSKGRLQYEIQGTIIAAEPTKRRFRKRSPRNDSPEAHERARLRSQARSKAYSRLALVYRPMWELILAEERAKLGLEPDPAHAPTRLVEVPREIMRDITDSVERETERARLRRGA